jgi:hypothetical protein
VRRRPPAGGRFDTSADRRGCGFSVAAGSGIMAYPTKGAKRRLRAVLASRRPRHPNAAVVIPVRRKLQERWGRLLDPLTLSASRPYWQSAVPCLLWKRIDPRPAPHLSMPQSIWRACALLSTLPPIHTPGNELESLPRLASPARILVSYFGTGIS